MAMVSSASPVPLSPIVLSKPSLDSEHVEAAGLLHLFAGGQASGLATEKPPPAVVRRQPPAPKPKPPPPQPPPPPPERRKPEKYANPKRRYHSASYKLSVVREVRPRPNLWAITPPRPFARAPTRRAGRGRPADTRPLAPPRPRPTLCLTSPTAASDMKPTPDRRCGGRSTAASSRRAATTPRSRRAA